MGTYGNQAGNYGSRKSKYHPDNAYFGNGAGFYPQGTNYGMYCDPYTVTTYFWSRTYHIIYAACQMLHNFIKRVKCEVKSMTL